jgi:hypothetical protein
MLEHQPRRYPRIDLARAIEAAKALKKKEGRARVSRTVAVKAWGYSSIHGQSKIPLYGLKHYGLIEYDGRSYLKLSQTGLTLCDEPPQSEHYQRALVEAALEPEMFRTLRETQPEASDDALMHELVRNYSYPEESARLLIACYRKTMELIKDLPVQPVRGIDSEAASPDAARRLPHEPPIEAGAITNLESRTSVFRLPLHGPREAEIWIKGGSYTTEDIGLLQDYLTLVMRSRGQP